MSSPTPIITPKPKKQAATSIKPQGFESPKVMLKKYTTYLWILVAGLPTLYTSILALGPVPERMQAILWGTAAFGLLCSWIRQRIEAQHVVLTEADAAADLAGEPRPDNPIS